MSDLIKATQDVTPAGSCIRVEKIVLTDEAKRNLSVDAESLPARESPKPATPARREAAAACR